MRMGLVGNGCVGEYHSPGALPVGTGFSSIGNTGSPVTRPAGFESYPTFHPVFLYESLRDRKPMDRLVTELILLRGSEREGGSAGFGMAASSFLLSWRYRMPIITAWSTPGAALLAASVAPGGGFAEAVGAFIGPALVSAGLKSSSTRESLIKFGRSALQTLGTARRDCTSGGCPSMN